ncbi:endonuclease/exonuclease/phosphatase family protein [Mucilaginibacter segetis]|uniref:Endonuclease/exonuclease/phosphatase family protein n=1 Tax=Mucilaginibacter segetis TaxID=2793071 RepID=A0A934PS14_9SPHI|nr:endonuclease/exonuclease/phosphatase family protein [Mucilaginibacter segetis]MBK0377990.1 endonuclease/exonuclease/phosphatase family protein [Mucilaginibacter segetis]
MKGKRKLTFIDKLFLWLNYLLCLALLLSYLSPYINPEKFWVIAFFGLAYPPLLLANLIMLAYWLIRKSRLVLLPVITILVGWNVLCNNIGLRFPTETSNSKGADQLRVMTYNVHDFKPYGSNNDISTKHEILEIISKSAPDVIGIQEFYTRKRGQYDMLDSMKKIMGTNFYYFEPFDVSYDQASGMAVFSRYPIIKSGLVKLPTNDIGNQCLYIDIQKGNNKIRIYSMHLQSIRFEPEDYKYLGDLSKTGKTNMHATKRLGSKLKIAFIKRSRQVIAIKAHTKTCPYPYVISGDFNDTPASFAVNQMAKGLKNSFREKGSGLGRTYNGDFPNYQIDYIMASPQFEVVNYQIVKRRLSDHYPVFTDLILN